MESTIDNKTNRMLPNEYFEPRSELDPLSELRVSI